jgi:hypothetical protein
MSELVCSKGSSSQTDILVIFLLLVPLVLLVYLLYNNPCFIKKRARSLYDWIFVGSDIDWPGHPEGCTELPL